MFQYWSAWNNYNAAISYFVTVPKYRMQAMDIAKSDKLIDSKRKRDRHKTKVCPLTLLVLTLSHFKSVAHFLWSQEEIREEEENILKQVIASKMDIR